MSRTPKGDPDNRVLCVDICTFLCSGAHPSHAQSFYFNPSIINLLKTLSIDSQLTLVIFSSDPTKQKKMVKDDEYKFLLPNNTYILLSEIRENLVNYFTIMHASIFCAIQADALTMETIEASIPDYLHEFNLTDPKQICFISPWQDLLDKTKAQGCTVICPEEVGGLDKESCDKIIKTIQRENDKGTKITISLDIDDTIIHTEKSKRFQRFLFNKNLSFFLDRIHEAIGLENVSLMGLTSRRPESLNQTRNLLEFFPFLPTSVILEKFNALQEERYHNPKIQLDPEKLFAIGDQYEEGSSKVHKANKLYDEMLGNTAPSNLFIHVDDNTNELGAIEALGLAQILAIRVYYGGELSKKNQEAFKNVAYIRLLRRGRRRGVQL